MLLLYPGLITFPHHHPVKSMFIFQKPGSKISHFLFLSLMVRMRDWGREARVKLGSENLPPMLPQSGWALRESSLVTQLWGHGVRVARTGAGLS